MRVKANAAQAKANKLARAGAMGALDEEAIRHPVQTWSARMLAYTYTVACPDPGLREPPKRMQLVRLRMWYARVMGGDADGQGEKAGHEAE